MNLKLVLSEPKADVLPLVPSGRLDTLYVFSVYFFEANSLKKFTSLKQFTSLNPWLVVSSRSNYDGLYKTLNSMKSKQIRQA